MANYLDHKMKLRFTLLSALISLSVAFVLLESSLRLFKQHLIHFVGETHQPCILVEDDKFGHRYLPNTEGWLHRNFEIDNVVAMNSQGFHDVERDPEYGIGQSTILAVGDSFTAGLSVPVSETWTQVLESRLNKEYEESTYQVINLGLPGTGTDVHLRILEENLNSYKPEYVILGFFSNDISDVAYNLRYWDCHKGYVLIYENPSHGEVLKAFLEEEIPSAVSKWFYRNIYSFRLATFLFEKGFLLRRNRIFPSDYGMIDSTLRDPPDEVGHYLLEMRRLSILYQFDLLVVPLPTKGLINGSLARLKKFVSPITLEQLDIIDVSSTVQQIIEAEGLKYEENFWKNDGHLNAKGNAVFAHALSIALDERLK